MFEQAGYLHVFDPKANKTDQLTINAAGDCPWMMTRFEDVTARMANIGLSPTGKRVLVEARGEIFTIPEEKGDVRNLTNSSGSAERQPAWSPDGKWISYFSDKSGEYKLVIESPRSNGQLAYVYVPNTGQGGFDSFNRYYFAQQDKQGAVIDERYNGGGSAADYIIDVLQRDFDGYFNNVAGDRRPFTSPSAGIWGPKVMIINEMAGSGGDLMPYMFRSRTIGPLVGKRTWGGLVHTADTPQFIDGGSVIAPRGGFFTRDGKWAVENEGTGPDIDVENWPKDVIAGR